MFYSKTTKLQAQYLASQPKQLTEMMPWLSSRRPDPFIATQRELGNKYLQVASAYSDLGKETLDWQRLGAANDRNIASDLIQAKRSVGAPDDIYEQEADRVAGQITQLPDLSGQTEANLPNIGGNIQRLSPDGSTEESVSDFHLSESAGQPLSPSTRQYMEPRFGIDFGQVRLHSDENAHRAASQIRARAFTYGHHILLGKEESEQDNHLMAHELTHVIQQDHSPGQSTARTGDRIQRLPFGIRLPSEARGLDPAKEEPILRAVYGSSLNYGDIYLSDALGGGGRPFTLYIPFVGTIIQIGPSAYTSPGSNPKLLIHEAAHSWQSQHYRDRAQYMSNSLASQAAASIVGGSAYCYIPGKPFNEYAAEQIAQQAENGEAAIISHMSSVAAGTNDPDLNLIIPRWETPGSPGVKC